ncbi:Outer membrane protein (Porin) [Candidatus Nitrotoga sp. HW29]|uniref:porin n=1 Tax=Candidatus Nitrotoga sp. HW29 TaxID=2886963 RepID=UPI001EF3D163|nr:porin [Candidatus Nitrotoga sp. HW29]CAH1904031.1 Outer membrane protein (Porin) [Candidatus Nitrotoga sp. HW29]
MNMNKSLIALAVASVFASSAAIADVSIYGQANVSYDVIQNDTGRDSQGVASNGSRIGFKGSEDLGGGLSAIWQIENQIAIGSGLGGTENPGSQTQIAFRDTFAGLKFDQAGTVRLGRFDTPYKLATRGMDMFHNTLADNRSLMGIGHDVRASNSVGFNSLNYAGFSVAASYFGDQGGTAPGFNTPVNGTLNSLINTNEGYSIAGMYNAGPFYGTAAYQSVSNGLSYTNLSTDAWKIGGGYSMDAFALNAVYERISNRHGSGNSNAWYLSGKYNMTTNDALKLAYTDVNHSVSGGSNSGAKQYSVGYDHKMTNRTTLYALYTKLDNDNNGNYLLGWNSASTSVSNPGIGQSPSAFSVGMKHSF